MVKVYYLISSTSPDTVRNVTIANKSQKLMIIFSTPLNENNVLSSGGLDSKHTVSVIVIFTDPTHD